jgi:hypothetical protein
MSVLTKILFAGMLLSLCACDDQYKNCKSWIDQSERQKIFLQCLQLARQPSHNHEDDNGHLVEACDDAAYHQSGHSNGCEYSPDTRP